MSSDRALKPNEIGRHTSAATWRVVLAIAAVYFAAAKLGLTMAFVAKQVTAVWPPAGIGLAALLLFGTRVWPGILLGAFLANVTASEPVATAFGIAVGNTLEAVIGAKLLRHFVAPDLSLQRMKDVLGLVCLAAAISPMVSATIGVTSLCLGAVQPWGAYRSLWWVWWLGDATGDLVMAPLLLTWATTRRCHWQASRIAEAAALFGTLVMTTMVVFTGLSTADTMTHPLVYIVFPFVIWAALRFGQVGTTSVTFVASVVAILGTVNGLGPFAKGSVSESLILLQEFMAVVAVTGLILGAAITESRRAERRAAALYVSASILAESETLEEAATSILETVCRRVDWDVGVLWMLDRSEDELRCVNLWRLPEQGEEAFASAMRKLRFTRGLGIPGRVWATAKPLWLANVVDDTSVPDVAAAAATDGLRSAFGIPIVVGGKVNGVMEFFSHQVRPSDDRLLQTMAALGYQVGHFIDRKQAERAIAELNEKLTQRVRELQTILDTAPVGIMIAQDTQCKIIASNRILAEMLGMPFGENISKSRDDVEKASYRVYRMNEELPAHELPMQQAAAGAGVREDILDIVRADGSRVTVLATAKPVLDESGAVRGAVGVCVDITALREAEDALREASRRKDEFLAMLAHELRNPLSAISNAAQVLKRTDEKEHREWSREIILNQVTNLSRMIDDLLDVSRITSGKIQLRTQPLNLIPIVKSTIDSVRPLIEERKHKLTVALCTKPIRINGDPTRLEQVLVNLLTNAAKYTEMGGRILLSAESSGDDAIIRVRDSGIGMSQEFLSHAFDLFAQGDRSIARSEGGLGIGLTLVKSLVEMHGGTVTASSDGPGTGSEFTVCLPLLMEGHDESVTPSEPSARVKASHVLIVDDNAHTAQGLGRLLTLFGHDVALAHDGPAALEAARSRRPDVILLDIGLPGMDGYQVAQTLRNDGFSDTVIIAVSGYGEEKAVARSRATGFNHHLVKPVDLDDLARLLSQTVR